MSYEAGIDINTGTSSNANTIVRRRVDGAANTAVRCFHTSQPPSSASSAAGRAGLTPCLRPKLGMTATISNARKAPIWTWVRFLTICQFKIDLQSGAQHTLKGKGMGGWHCRRL